jgi:hypothetical protein
MLEKSGVTFIETSPTYGKANSLLSKINKSVELTQGPDVAGNMFESIPLHCIDTARFILF